MATVKMKKGDVVANINDSPESIAHAYSMGYVPLDKMADAKLKTDLQPETVLQPVAEKQAEPRRGRPPKEA